MSSNALTHWDDLRSELLARLPRCEGRTEPENGPIFATVDQPEPYYGPTREARAAVNAILGLPVSAGQQEQQNALKCSGGLETAVDALGEESLDGEGRSALALLLLDAIESMASYGPVRADLLRRVRWHLRHHPQVQSRMRYFWTHMDASGAVLEALG
jgi:hypothetical protein